LVESWFEAGLPFGLFLNVDDNCTFWQK